MATEELADSLQDRWAQVGEYDIHFLAARHATPGAQAVVYLAGFLVGGHSAIPLSEELARYYRLYAPDLPGYGASNHPGRTLTQSEQADVIAGLLDVLEEPSADLIANSFSAQIAVEFAACHPDRLRRLVLIGPGVDSEARSPFRQLLRFIRNIFEEDALVPGMVRDYLTVGPRRLVETAWYALQHRMEEKLQLVQAPTLVVRGERDMIVPQRWVQEITALLPHGRLVEIPDQAHGIERVGVHALAPVIRDFLDAPVG